jgi:hypothetical protein
MNIGDGRNYVFCIDKHLSDKNCMYSITVEFAYYDAVYNGISVKTIPSHVFD